MDNIFFEGQVLWSQIDANGHLRHSAYADICTQARSNMMKVIGLSMERCLAAKVGPILFREETLYFKEVKMDEVVKVRVYLTKNDTVKSRFAIRHELLREDGTKCAQVLVEGAWMNLVERKLTVLSEDMQAYFDKIPKSDDYVQI